MAITTSNCYLWVYASMFCLQCSL